MKTKICKDCNRELPIDDFYRNARYLGYGAKDGREVMCKKCWSERKPPEYKEERRKYWRKNKERFRAHRIQKEYGLSPHEYQSLIEKQKGRCAICNQKPKRWLDVDHCHGTNIVRGLLCNNCNQGIGLFKDDCALMKKAIEYLCRH